MKLPIRHVYGIVMLLLSFASKGKNLVPNPGFENYNACPNALSVITYSLGYNYFPFIQDWVSPINNLNPDYLHTCAAQSTGVMCLMPALVTRTRIMAEALRA